MPRLIDKYLPADYSDCFSRDFTADETMSVDSLFNAMFGNFPAPVRWLLKLRDILVRPFGLRGGATFRDRIIERNDEEIIVGADDKHLAFWVSVFCSSPENGKQNASVSTVVKFHNFLGRIYFVGIWLFHKLIVGAMFRRAVKSILLP